MALMPVAEAEALIAAKLLAPNLADDHGAVAAAIGRLLDHLTGART